MGQTEIEKGEMGKDKGVEIYNKWYKEIKEKGVSKYLKKGWSEDR